ncbi:hypothetical protein NDU88_003026 [Pleurodeles waltl]|uniref:Uncharacterized protein n=1 Tax=Pleurodeles waltl TaxID=8319 RepID=A0AAV7UXA7_PLEWA|nr:hypothetical protein NDU88_003026 [Pleurodeles waltl]
MSTYVRGPVSFQTPASGPVRPRALTSWGPAGPCLVLATSPVQLLQDLTDLAGGVSSRLPGAALACPQQPGAPSAHPAGRGRSASRSSPPWGNAPGRHSRVSRSIDRRGLQWGPRGTGQIPPNAQCDQVRPAAPGKGAMPPPRLWLLTGRRVHWFKDPPMHARVGDETFALVYLQFGMWQGTGS